MVWRERESKGQKKLLLTENCFVQRGTTRSRFSSTLLADERTTSFSFLSIFARSSLRFDFETIRSQNFFISDHYGSLIF